MSLLFIDSSDHYTAAQVTYKYTSGSVGAVVAGRHGNGISNPNLRMALANPDIASNRFILGTAWYPTSLSGTGIFSVRGPALTYDLGLASDVDGRLIISSALGNNGGVATGSDPDIIRTGHWYFIEMQGDVTSTPTGGGISTIEFNDLKVWCNDELVIDLSGHVTDLDIEGLIFTVDVPTFGWSAIGRGAGSAIHDDFYVCDGAGSAPFNARLGDIEIDVTLPNGAGASTGFTPVGNVNNFANVDEATPNDDTDYNAADTAGLEDLHEMQDIATNDGIIGAQMLIASRRTDEGFASVTPLMKQDSTTYDGMTRSIASSYFYRNRDVYETAPDGSPWTDDIFNSIQAGYRRET